MLKKVIAPVDFSNASDNALLFAAEICKRAGAELTIVHAMEDGNNEQDANHKLRSVAAVLPESFVKYETLLVQGDLVDVMERQVQALRPDLIVMGTKGASGLKRIFVGSNTIKVMASTNVPVFVIPDEARFENFNEKGKNRIVLATDLEEVENEAGLELLKEIAQLIIAPHLKVLNIRPEHTGLDFLKGMERAALVSRFKPELETERVTVFSSGVIDGINFYLDKNDDTGMIAMVARDTGKLIQRHLTREMAAVTRYPLLVLHTEKVN